MHRISIDLVCPLPRSSPGEHYIFTTQDASIKFEMAAALKDETAISPQIGSLTKSQRKSKAELVRILRKRLLAKLKMLTAKFSKQRSEFKSLGQLVFFKGMGLGTPCGSRTRHVEDFGPCARPSVGCLLLG